MKKNIKALSLYFSILFTLFLIINFIETKSKIIVNDNTVIEISQTVSDNTNYKKAEFTSGEGMNYFFKYQANNIPSSKIGAFRFEFDQFTELAQKTNKVYCSFFDDSTTDSQLMEELSLLDSSTSCCIGEFNEAGIFDGIIEYNDSKKKLGIYLVSSAALKFTARIYVRTGEKILPIKEDKAMEDESYSLVPYTIVISNFREYASKILFYSFTRELQMYYVLNESPYPIKLFSGNILSVFTNPNMVHQKYHDANTMVLLTNPFGAYEMVGEIFKFQVKFFESQFLLDYFVSSNNEGRSLNSPLSINMTECVNPYYIVLNYNQPQNEVSLYIDEVYGKIKSISVAPTLKSNNWDDMIENDLIDIDLATKKYILPKNAAPHLDVYKIECEIPVLLNFYYTDESATITELDFGKVSIINLKSYKTVTVPFKEGVNSPEITIDVFNPYTEPFVIIDDGQNDYLIKENSLIKTMPWNINNGIIVKERGGSSDTRVIIKVGYSTSTWEEVSDYITYSNSLNMYVFTFPNDDSKYNYTHVNLVTRGLKEGDNIKYCYATNIGSAITPSLENCYRVSLNNPYSLKMMNPIIMYKNYEVSEDLNFYISLMPVVDTDKLNIEAFLASYGTNLRNYEGNNNLVTIDSMNQYSTILTAPKNKTPSIFVQIQTCEASKSIEYEITNAYDQKSIISKTKINAGTTNYFKIFKNVLMETELELYGDVNVDIFVKHAGILSTYSPSIKEFFNLIFDSSKNQLNIENPLKNYETMKYTIFFGPEGDLSKKGITLCSFTESKKGEIISKYNKTITSNNEITSVYLNLVSAGLEIGDKFEAIVYAEQQENSKMSFLSEIIKGNVGDITTKSVYEIKNKYSEDDDYYYISHESESEELTYYFSYLPDSVMDVPIGAFSIELNSETKGSFSHVDCAFTDPDKGAFDMIEAVEDAIEKDASYCIGGQSNTNSKKYNYIFKYEYNNKTPKRLIIKVSNGYYTQGTFSIFMKKGEGVQIEPTDMNTQKEYGKDEETKKSVIPYIVDLKTIRGEEKSDDKISKIMFYSQHLEMQMYYLDNNNNAPILLFTGNIMLVFTKLTLAEQKYHATKLILLSENIMGQDHPSLGSSFRFHSKMFRTEYQIEYFVSANTEGRTLNFPLSLEMNTCSSENNKFYYILNYNKAEEERTLHLDMIFGKFKKAKIVSEINAEKWDSLVSNSMTEITNYQINLSKKSQHIDIVEIECQTPFLINAYYNYKDEIYSDLKRGDIIVKNLGGGQSTSISVDSTIEGGFYYAISLYNPTEQPDVTLRFSVGTSHRITENSLQVGMLLFSPENIFIINNVESETRIIFKIGFGVESEWIDEKDPNIEGKLYSEDNKFVYKFPLGERGKNFTSVKINVRPLGEEENIKFCYSTNIGMAIDASKENCFRTGKNIPYELTFLNPLISVKNYKSYSDSYYVSFKPWDDTSYISLDITEEKYEEATRTNEGIPNVIILEPENITNTILSIPETDSKKLFIQLAACFVGSDSILYSFSNALSGDIYQTGNIKLTDKDMYYQIENNYMEVKTQLSGNINDKAFIKYSGTNNYNFIIQAYKSTFDDSQNVVSMIKPIYDEEFTFTVLVGEKGTLDEYTLCTFVETKPGDYNKLADYVNTFTSISSNNVIHYIDFQSFSYPEGKEFDLLVYAVQTKNIKMEFLYKVISGKVGKASGVLKMSGLIDSNYVTQDFAYSYASNYLYYDFSRKPNGNIAAIKIINQSKYKITKIGCVFTQVNIEDEDMIKAVNQAILDGTSFCIGEPEQNSGSYDALVNAGYPSNRNRLVIQIVCQSENNEGTLKDEEETPTFTINMRINGFSISDVESQYNEEEKLTSVPYVIDLLYLREHKLDQGDYVSKVLFYSNTREMQMFYVGNGNSAPVELFSGNIMMVYTNEELIKQKYHGATTMILITDSLASTEKPHLGEKFRFRVNFFNSAKQMQYYVSSNPNGRLLNNPVSIEMLSCDQPYYYILNYNKVEGTRKLHIDTIFGQTESIKLSTQLSDNNWYDLVNNLEAFEGNEVVLEEQDTYHMDIIEVTCKIPLLLNLYYTDPAIPHTTRLEVGDVSIISLSPGQTNQFSFALGLNDEFVYSFNVFKEQELSPSILISFEDGSSIDVKENGLYTKKSKENFSLITVKNKETIGSSTTRIIFKFGHVIESSFTKIQNDIYNNLNEENREHNLFGYKFDNSDSRLNYTKVDFLVETREENVKFCYSTNLGAYINPSLTNCFRVGQANSYTISVLNPFIMFKNYYTGNIFDYYVGFETVDVKQNITITPKKVEYSTKTRNEEGKGNLLKVSNDGNYSTILTAPSKNINYLFVHIQVCTPDQPLLYEFKNAYNSSSLEYSGEIQANTINNFKTIENTKLDTELDIQAEKGVKVFVKHSGVENRYQPVINDITFSYNNKEETISFTSPIEGEEFKYTIYLDKRNNLKEQGYTLCSFLENNKIAHFNKVVKSSQKNIEVELDFSDSSLQGYEDFDIMILAEQQNNGKLTFLSEVFNKESGKKSEESSNIGLIIIIIVLSIILIVGGAVLIFLVRKKSKTGSMQSQIEAKATSLSDINGTPQDKLLTSQASVA